MSDNNTSKPPNGKNGTTRRIIRAKRPPTPTAGLLSTNKPVKEEAKEAESGSATVTPAPAGSTTTMSWNDIGLTMQNQASKPSPITAFAESSKENFAAVVSTVKKPSTNDSNDNDDNDDDDGPDSDYYEDSDDYDDDDYDDDESCDCENCRMEKMSSFFKFMKQVQEAEENGGGSDFDDDDDDSDTTCACSVCVARREREAEENDSDFNDEDEDSDRCDCSVCVSRRRREAREAEDDSECNSSNSTTHYDNVPDLLDREGNIVKLDKEEEEEEIPVGNGETCAICMECPTNKNPFVKLPCCGGVGTVESTSTMQFCSKCMIKTLKTQMKRNVENEFGPFGQVLLAMNRRGPNDPIVGECPRCRVTITCNNPSSRKAVIEKATFEQAMEYASKRPGMRQFLFVLALAHYNVVPIELFEMDLNRIQKLAQWGILTTVQDGAWYKIEPENHKILIDFMTSKEERPDLSSGDDDSPNISDDEWKYKARYVLAAEYLSAILVAHRQRNYKVAIQMLHCAIIMVCKAVQILPFENDHALGKVISYLLVALNGVLITTLVSCLLAVGVVAIAGFLLLITTGFIVHQSVKPDGKISLIRGGLFIASHLGIKGYYGMSSWILVKLLLLQVLLRGSIWLTLKKYKKLPLDLLRCAVWGIHGWYILSCLPKTSVAMTGDLSLPDDSMQGASDEF